MFTETEVKVILILADDEGHAEWELADFIGMKNSNLNPILKELRGKGVICQGERRKSRKERRIHKDGDYGEYPYHLCDNLNNINFIIKELILSDRILDAGYSLSVIKKSRFSKLMKKKFGEEFTKSVADNVRNHYQPYIDESFKSLQQQFAKEGRMLPFLDDDLVDLSTRCCKDYSITSPIRSWYEMYLDERRDLMSTVSK